MKSKTFLRRTSFAAAAVLISFVSAAQAQTNVLTVNPSMRTVAKRGGTFSAKVTVQLKPGYHVNSNKPAEDYIIPLRLTWDKGAFELVEVTFPEAKLEKYQFSATPVSVFSGSFDIVSKFKASPSAPAGLGVLSGKLRYQACTETMCLAPKTIDIKMPVETF